MEKITNIESTLWEMANKLRGAMDASEYKNYILGFMFYMFLSDKQEKYLTSQDLIEIKPGQTFTDAFLEIMDDQENYKEYEEDITAALGYMIKPDYTWPVLIQKIQEGKIIPSDYQDIFDSFNESTKMNKDAEQDFRGIFADMNLGDSRLGNSTIERAKSLGRIVELVNTINFEEKSDKDVLGHIYEYLIGQFAANAGKKGGEFYTPHEVSQIMARIVTNGVKKEADQDFSVFDPACGSGSLLLTVGHALNGDQNPGVIKYYGQELNTTTYNIARMNLIMHDVDYKDMTLRNNDTLKGDWPDGPDAFGIDRPRSFDAVVANPPYSAHWDAEESMMKDPRFKDYGKLAPKTKADMAFLLDGLYHLNGDGTMAIVLPHGVLFRGAAEGVIRKTLIEKNHIDTVIGLPANLFYGASIPTIIMILKKNKPSKDILFIDASQYFKKAKNKNVLTEEDIDRIVKAYEERKDIEKYAHVASLKEVQENDYNLNIPRYVDTSEEEEEIDIQEVLKSLHEIDKEIEELNKVINEDLISLGIIKESAEGIN
ncbi:type I restriction-modification system subunit M [Ileibacterium valens]|uniref:type I restriction-modification system subunit M n=1 Tax=Ileibacterium valens TaxID=1862668 RepID=UPI0024B92144|nr:type I restriction-modification system subunit M [Ileibacterium valens]